MNHVDFTSMNTWSFIIVWDTNSRFYLICNVLLERALEEEFIYNKLINDQMVPNLQFHAPHTQQKMVTLLSIHKFVLGLKYLPKKWF